MKRRYNLAIIGAGASGLMAAISAAMSGLIGIVVLEHNDRVGKKLLTTGNGRCNITNVSNRPAYFGSQLFVDEIMSSFNTEQTMKLFEDLGLLLTVEDEGRVYPKCSQASAVLDILRFACQRLGIEILCSVKIDSISKNDGYYKIFCNSISIDSSSIIIACGGMAAPSTGSDGSINHILKDMKYSFKKQKPSLVPIMTDPALIKPLKGVRTKGEVLLIRGKKEIIARETGEIQFNENNISGVCVMQLSAHIDEIDDLTLSIRMFPDMKTEDMLRLLKAQKQRMKHIAVSDFLTGIVNKRLGMQIVKRSICDKMNRLCGTLSDNELAKIAEMMLDLRFPVKGLCGFDKAQVTNGGLITAQFDRRTLMSNKDRGLFACGEILDVHWLCGGYNLQWAWSTGYVAGKSAAKYILEDGKGFNLHMAR